MATRKGIEPLSADRQSAVLPLNDRADCGVGYGIRTRVVGVKVRPPNQLADNPTQKLARVSFSEMRFGVAGEIRTHDAQVHSLRRQTAGDGHTEAHSRSDRVMSWSVLWDSNPHQRFGRPQC